jgi:hypothetical protein
MADHVDSEAMSRSFFIYTVVGTAAFIGAIIVFVLL